MSRTLVHVVDGNPLQCLQDRLTCRAEKCFFSLKHYIKEPKYAHFVSRMQQMFYFGTYSHFSSHHLNRDDARVYNVHLQ